MTSADHADDLVPISVSHRLQRFFDEGILVGQCANETCVQHCIRDPSDPLLMHLIIGILEVMECGDGVAVGWNCELVELVIQSLRCYLTVRVVPFSRRSKTSQGDLHLSSMDLSALLCRAASMKFHAW